MAKNDFVDAIARATVTTISDLCGIKVIPEKAFIKGKRDQMPFAVGGVLGLSSHTFTGSVALCFPRLVFLRMVSKMLGEPQAEVGAQNEDAAAELLNIIFGLAKTLLNKKGNAVVMAIPSILRGGSVQSSYSKIHEVRVVPFRLDDGSEFYVEYVLKTYDEKEKSELKIQPEAPQSLTPKSVPMETFVDPFVDNVLKTLKIQCGIEAKAGVPVLKRAAQDYTFDIAGMVGITARSGKGSFLMAFDRSVYLQVVSKMLGQAYTEMEPGLEEAVSELVNIVFGGAKATLNAVGHGIQMAIPSVVFGRQIMTHSQLGTVVPIETPFGRFYVEVILE